ncbi:MAG: iron ABC transporter permease [Fibrobacteraceae bacterium]|nr:iron ABC transporter permease [Fibrobacteraceae bacterium]
MRRTLLGFAFLAFVVLFLFSFTLVSGSSALHAEDVWHSLIGNAPVFVDEIVWQIRIPKACAALFAGISLGVSGLVLQSVFKNPLAGPFVLGVSSGANLGVALVLLAGLGRGSFGIVPCAAVGAFAVIVLILFASKFISHPVSLLIVGLMLGYFVDAVVSFLMYTSSAEALRGFMAWGFGSFSRLLLADVPFFGAVSLAGLFLSVVGIRYLNAAQVSDSFAESLGVNVKMFRLLVLSGSSLLAAGATVYCGPIGFLGLVSPHIAFGIFRTSNHRILLPATAFVGAALALLSGLFDSVPLSAVTSLFGAPIVFWVLLRSKSGGRNA